MSVKISKVCLGRLKYRAQIGRVKLGVRRAFDQELAGRRLEFLLKASFKRLKQLKFMRQEEEKVLTRLGRCADKLCKLAGWRRLRVQFEAGQNLSRFGVATCNILVRLSFQRVSGRSHLINRRVA
jgi:hypothetical protein